MFRYRLRTLLLLMILGPPVLATGYVKWQEHLVRQEVRQEVIKRFVGGCAEFEEQRRQLIDAIMRSRAQPSQGDNTIP